MTDQPRSLFALDTNIFIETQNRYYAHNLCPGFWESLEHHCIQGRLSSIDRVREEILAGSDTLTKWAETAPSQMFASSLERAVMDEFADMTKWVMRSEQFTDSAKLEFAQAADGWVAAFAKVHDGIVVTHEARAPNARARVPLPSVCEQFGIDRTNTFDMLQVLGVQFDWKGKP